MPISHPANAAPILQRVAELRPSTILDLGVGYGDYGPRLRGLWPKALIFGFEAFGNYRNERWYSYDSVDVADFTQYALSGFDLVLMIDSLEHLEPNIAGITLASLITRNKNVIVSVPEGHYPQGPVNGNKFEIHRSTWTANDLECRGGRIVSRHAIDKGLGIVAEFEEPVPCQ